MVLLQITNKGAPQRLFSPQHCCRSELCAYDGLLRTPAWNAGEERFQWTYASIHSQTRAERLPQASKNSRKPCKVDHDDCEPFIQWMARQVREERWSLDFGPENFPCPYLTCLMYSGVYATGSGYGKTGASKGAVLRNAPPLSAKEQKSAIGKWIPSLASVKVVKPSRSLPSKR